MNEDTLNACQEVFNQKYARCIIFAESPEGEISYYGERSDEHWEYLFNKPHYGFNKKFIHLFRFQEGELEWLESYNFDTDMVDIPIEISDEVFLAVAKQAHEKNITFNDEIINIIKQYIDGKVTI
jgi:hypothetical protein